MAGTAQLGGTVTIRNSGFVTGGGTIGATTINSGGTLAPSGLTSLTVNGNLTAHGGGTIKPSDAAPLIVNGTLTLDASSNYDYRLHGYGASSPGSATTRVNGNLVLNNATLNLGSSAQPAIGYHRVITYSGALSPSNGTFVIGTMPSTGPVAYTYQVDASQAGKVDVLVGANGLNILQLWGTTSAGGADGVWSAANPNWFNLGGSTTTSWGGGYGVFRGPGGIVTLDHSNGPLSAVGLQFAGGGYTLTGDSLDLHGYNNGGVVITTPEIRVLDGETARINATITGTAGLEKTGDGLLILGGANSYSGGTFVSGGTLQISADGNLGAGSGNLTLDSGALHTTANMASSRAVVLRGTGAIETNAGTTLTLNGLVSGAGGLIKWGDGTLLLTGNNSWAGGTLITAGTVQAGASTALPGMTDWLLTGGKLDLNGHDLSMRLMAGTGGEIALGSANLTVRQADDSLYAGSITGSGRLLKEGAGALILTGTNSYSGGTVIRDGTLAVIADANLGQAGSTLAFDGGGRLATLADIASNRSMTVSGTGTIDTAAGTGFAFGGSIGGNGNLVKEGRGTLTLTGNSSGFAGSTTVSAGTLVVNGTLGGGLDILAGGRLQGSGTVGPTIIQSGGAIAPGNSIGTLSVTGDIRFERGATYEVEVSPGGTSSDLIHASGKARLFGGSVVHVGEDGLYRPNQRYTIITADQGVEGRFDGVNSRYLFLDPRLDYDANTVSLTLLRNDLSFAAIAQTRNQAQTALGLQSLGDTHPLWLSFTQLRDVTEARRVYDSLSGEIHATAKAVVIEGSQAVRGAVSDRIRAVFDGIGAPRIATLAYASGQGAVAAPAGEGFALWARGFGSWGQTRGDGNAASVTRSSGGLLAGFDIPLASGARIGALAGYSRSTFEVAGRGSQGTADNYHVGLYGGAELGGFRLTGAATYAWHELSTRRTAAFSGFDEALRSDYDARSFQAFGEIAHRFDLGRVALEPFANLAYVNLRSGDFAETGGVAALSARAQSTSVTFATLGLRAETRFDVGNTAMRLGGTLGWRHATGDVTPLSQHAFSGGAPFSIAGTPIARNTLAVGASLALTLTAEADISLAYDGQLAQRASDHAFNARFAVRF